MFRLEGDVEACDLTKKKCKPCEGGVEPLSRKQAEEMLATLKGWRLEEKSIKKQYGFKDFVQAMAFVNRLADLAEAEGHHPDIFIHYNKVEVSLWTHAIGGLSENDFILAAKSDELA